MKKLTKEEFIHRSNKIHNNKFDYSLVKYIDAHTKVKIICPIHGIFEQMPYDHMKGRGCNICGGKMKSTTEDFIKKSIKIHNDKYDYSLVEYIDNKTKVKIICDEHGIFEQLPSHHINGNGCPKCGNSKKYEKCDVINNFINKHGYRYDYSNVVYINTKTKVEIICTEHGIFEQRPYQHTKGNGCPKCKNKNIRLKTIKRIEENKLNGYQLVPNFNKTACEIFDKISLKEGIHILHAMNGGEYHIKELGYWLDGYDSINNVAYEFDEKHHFNKNDILKDKDLIRQKEIEEFINCRFIRIES